MNLHQLPLVSCVMPTKNRRKFLPRALRMFARQDWPRKELHIIEDGEQAIGKVAADELAELLASVPGQHPVYYHRCDGTLGAKLNFGARKANGPVIVNWDDDDWNAPDRISIQVRHMQICDKPVVGFSSLIYYTEGEPHGWEYTGDAWYASGSSHCYTRDWVLAHPRPDITVGEDNQFYDEARTFGAVSNLSGITSLVACDHDSNCSARGSKDMRDSLRACAHEFRKLPLSEFAAAIEAAN